MPHDEAVGVPYQWERWLSFGRPMSTCGIVTTLGRTFHSTETCSGFLRGRKYLTEGELETPQNVTAAEAYERHKGLCGKCW